MKNLLILCTLVFVAYFSSRLLDDESPTDARLNASGSSGSSRGVESVAAVDSRDVFGTEGYGKRSPVTVGSPPADVGSLRDALIEMPEATERNRSIALGSGDRNWPDWLSTGTIMAERIDETGTRRVRIVRVSNFKYPLIRTESLISAPESAQMPLISVADHLIVQKPSSLEEEVFVREVRRRGYEIRKTMFAPNHYLIEFGEGDSEVIIDEWDRAIQYLRGIGVVDPDSVVSLTATPGDPFAHQLWGLQNLEAKVTLTSGPDSGISFSEGGKMAYSGAIPPVGISGTIVFCGIGDSGDFPAEVNGEIALVERGTLSFAAKAANAADAGAAAVLIYNNEPGNFSGTLGEIGDWLPVVALGRDDGLALLAAAGEDCLLGVEDSDADISAPEAWDRSTGSENVVVGVIDSGIDYTHPDLASNIWNNPGEMGTDSVGNDRATNGIDDDGNGLVDDVHGWDFYNDDNDPMDDNSHGTHAAGTIGAVGDNGLGITGVSWTVRLAAIKFLGASGSGLVSDGIDSIYYSTSIGVDLTSNSWGSSGYTQALFDAVEDANSSGILFVAAAGNSATAQPAYPAGLENLNVLSVAATDSNDRLASFSNYGLPHVDLAAPGVLIFSTLPQFMEPDYGFKSGTSMACPHVAGAAALLKSAVPSMTHLEIRNRLLETVDSIPSLANRVVSSGRLNVAAAIDELSEEPEFGITRIEVVNESPSSSVDGVINPGETVSLLFTIQNRGFSGVAGLVGRLTSDDSNVSSIPDAECWFGDVSRLGDASASDEVRLTIDPAAPVPTNIAFDLELVDSFSRTWTVPLMLQVSSSHQIEGVVFLDGIPLENATVEYSGSTSGAELTDSNGAFAIRVPIGEHRLSASFGDSKLSRTPEQSFVTPGDHSGVRFELNTATVEGTVLDDLTGSPVEGATVSFIGPVNKQQVTASDGTFSMSEIYGRPTEWKLVSSRFAEYDFASSTQVIQVPPDVTGLTLRMGWPEIDVEPSVASGLNVSVDPGEKTSVSLPVQNTGVADLVWQATLIGSSSNIDDRGLVLDEFEAPSDIGTRPNGSAYDGEFLYWYHSGILYKQDAKSGVEVEKSYLPDLIVSLEEDWRLAFFDGQYFWFEDLVPDPNDIRHNFIDLHAVDLELNLIVETVEIDRDLYVSVNYANMTRNNEGESWGTARACAFAEGDFWFYMGRVDRDEGKHRLDVARVDRFSGQLKSSFRLPAEVNYPVLDFSNDPMDLLDPTDFTYSGGALWIIQANESNLTHRRIYKVDPETGARQATILPLTNPANADFREILADETGALWLFDDHDDYSPKRIIRIDPGERLWMTASALGGSIPEGETFDLDLAFDGSILPDGIYSGAVRLSSNGNTDPQIVIPVQLSVGLLQPGNQPPTIDLVPPTPVEDGIVELVEGDSMTFITQVSDPDGDSLTRNWFLDGKRVGGALRWTYDVGYAEAGVHALSIVVSDGKGGFDSRAWRIQVANVNRPPVASDATYAVANNDAITIDLVASDPDGDELSWEILSAPTTGRISGEVPRLTYTPEPGFSGLADLSFRVNDGVLESEPATITWEVGYRRIEVSEFPLSVEIPFGDTAQRTITLENRGTMPLRYSAAMVSDRLVPDAGTLIETIGPLQIPEGDFESNLEGLAFDGTYLISSIVEHKGPFNDEWLRSQVVFFDPETGEIVGNPIPLPTDSASDYMWIDQMTWSGNSLWATNEGFLLGDLQGRMFEFGIIDGSLTQLHAMPQFPSDFGGYNTGLTFDHDNLWMLVTPTSSQNDPRGLYRIEPGTKKVLNTIPVPAFEEPNQQFGPIVFWNGVLWRFDTNGKPLLKTNPFSGDTLAMVPIQEDRRWHSAAADFEGGLFAKVWSLVEPEGESAVYRIHSGDYVLISPSSGTIPPGGTAQLTLAFNTAVAGAGTHTGAFRILSNDPDRSDIAVPYTFTVLPEPGNFPPVIQSASPQYDVVASPRNRIAFEISGVDPDGDVLAYRWYLDGVRQGHVDNSNNFGFIPGFREDSCLVEVEIDDGRGGMTSRQWNVDVSAIPFSVRAIASPAKGMAPLDVDFTALIEGGTLTDGPIAGTADLVVVEAEDVDAVDGFEDGHQDGFWINDDTEGGVGSLMVSVLNNPFRELDWGNDLSMSYDIQFADSGDYTLWMRVRAAGSCFVGIDGVQIGGAFDVGEDSGGDFRWVRHETPIPISAGQRTFRISARESLYRIDRFLFAKDPAYVPVGAGPVSTNLRLPSASLVWDFEGHLPPSTDYSPSARFEFPGVFPVHLNASTAEGSASTTLVVVAERLFSQWVFETLGSRPITEQGLYANPDGDPFINLLEFVFGLNPLVADGSRVIAVDQLEDSGDVYPRIRYSRALENGGVEVIVELSTNLSDWVSNEDGSPVTTTEGITVHEDGSATVSERSLTPLTSEPRQFLRIRVE